MKTNLINIMKIITAM